MMGNLRAKEMMGEPLYLLGPNGRLFGGVSWDWCSVEWLHLFSFQGLYEGLQQGFSE